MYEIYPVTNLQIKNYINSIWNFIFNQNNLELLKIILYLHNTFRMILNLELPV